MRAVLTKVKHASVTIDGELKGKIGRGFLILLGVAPDDTEEKCRKMADKLCSLRIFDDENDKINLSLDDVGGELLIVSQFTLYGNCRKGRRPEFLSAARPEIAIPWPSAAKRATMSKPANSAPTWRSNRSTTGRSR